MDIIAHMGRGPSHQVILRAWALYIIRFILPGDICNAWGEFGGRASQLSFLSLAPHIGFTENASFAISYDREVRSRIRRLVRRRDLTADYAKPLSEGNG